MAADWAVSWGSIAQHMEPDREVAVIGGIVAGRSCRISTEMIRRHYITFASSDPKPWTWADQATDLPTYSQQNYRLVWSPFTGWVAIPR